MGHQAVDIVFQMIVFVFALSVHEAAHAWMANKLGDPTARMLGRITLNPIKHADIFGTIIFPVIALVSHIPMLGWAKPTPVDTRNFKRPVLDDILTAVVGPISNFLLAAIALLLLAAIKLASPEGRMILFSVLQNSVPNTNSFLAPMCLLLWQLMLINVFLGVFNLIPVPPLDGSHVIRHFLPESALRVYDMVGMFGLMALVFLAPSFLGQVIYPFVGVFVWALLAI